MIGLVSKAGETIGHVTYVQVKCNVEKSETIPDRSDGDTGRETLLSPELVCNECVAVK